MSNNLHRKMRVPPEYFSPDSGLSARDVHLAMCLYFKAGFRTKIKIDMKGLSDLTGLNRESIRLSLRSLESKGLLTVVRTKRNLGKYSVSEYHLTAAVDRAKAAASAERKEAEDEKYKQIEEALGKLWKQRRGVH